MRRLQHGLTVVGLVVCLPLALLGARSAVAWGPAGSDQSRLDTESTSRVSSTGGKVRISGSVLTPLYPGVSSPIALSLTNKSSHVVRLGRIKVSVKRVSASNADAKHPCTKVDFAVTQMKKKLRLPQGTHTLASLGLASSSWPRVGMRNRPLNQDGCKGARVTLSFKSRPIGTR